MHGRTLLQLSLDGAHIQELLCPDRPAGPQHDRRSHLDRNPTDISPEPIPTLSFKFYLHGVAVDQLLLAERRQVACVDGVDALHAAGGRERPARPALRSSRFFMQIVISNRDINSVWF